MQKIELAEAISTRQRVLTGVKAGLYFGFVGLAAWSFLSLPPFPLTPKHRGPIASELVRATPPSTFVPGSLLVKFREDAETTLTEIDSLDDPSSDIRSRAARLARDRQTQRVEQPFSARGRRTVIKGAESTQTQRLRESFERIRLLHFPPDVDIPQLAEAFKALPEVEYAEPEFYYTIQLAPNDPYFSSSGSWRQSFQDLWGLHRIHAPAAWDVTTGSQDVVIAVSDTGLDYNHQELQGRLWINAGEDLNGNGIVDASDYNDIDDDGNGYIDDIRGWNFFDRNEFPLDPYGHGTHVAGTIGALTNNGIGVAGMTWGSKLMAVRGFSPYGYGPETDVANTIRYAADNGADIINMSWAGPPSQVIADAIAYAHSLDVVLVAAAGNNNFNVSRFSPANLPHVTSVAAWSPTPAAQGERASFSNWGEGIDVIAPGDDILSLRAANTQLGYILGNYTLLDGTSMAAPHVAGTAALIKSVFPNAPSGLVETILTVSADDVLQPGKDILSGYGLINAAGAVTTAQTIANQQPAAELKLSDVTIVVDSNFSSYRVRGLVENVGLIPATSVRLRLYEGDPAQSPAVHELSWSGIAPRASEAIDLSLPFRMVFETGFLVVDSEAYEYYSTNNQVATTVQYAPLPGWPIALPNVVRAPLSMANIDDDAGLELITGGPSASVYAWNSDGSSVPGWPKRMGGPNHHSVAVGDVNGDGVTDIVASSLDRRVYAWDRNGTLLPGWPAVLTNDPAGCPSLGDLDQDGILDVVVGTSLSQVYAWHGFDRDGIAGPDPLPGWPRPTSGQISACPTIADIDDDQRPEVITNGYYRVHIFHADGSIVPGWPQNHNGYGTASVPVVADIDGDGRVEVVAAARQIHAWRPDGTRLPGWWPTPHSSYGHDQSSPAIVDLDEDGIQDVVIGGADQSGNAKVYAWHGYDRDGLPGPDPIAGWPKSVGGPVFSSPAIADLDNDRHPEVVIGSNDWNVYAWHRDGQPVETWPRNIGGDVNSSPMIGDVDGDGDLEIAAGARQTGEYIVWPVRGSTSDQAPWPTLHHDFQRLGIFRAPGCNPAACPDLTGDGNVDASDVSSFAAAMANNDLRADFNGDEVVNIYDQNFLMSLLGSTSYSCANRCSQTTAITGSNSSGSGSGALIE